MAAYEQAVCSSSMAVALNRGVSYRRQGSSGLIWADPLHDRVQSNSRRSAKAAPPPPLQAAAAPPPSFSSSSSASAAIRASKTSKVDPNNNISLSQQRSLSTGDISSAKGCRGGGGGSSMPPDDWQPHRRHSPRPRKQQDSWLLRWIKKSCCSPCMPLSRARNNSSCS